MYPLVESIKVVNGQIKNLNYHQERLNRSMGELFPKARTIDLGKEISAIQSFPLGVCKVRVLFGPVVEKVEINPYTYRVINSLKVVYHNNIDYHLKYSDRQLLNELYGHRGNCEDVIIIKNGYVTDSYTANLLFFDGKHWFTPHLPLLKGTKRQFLLDCGLIFEKEIKESDMVNYQQVGLINAMIDFDEMPVVEIKDIRF